MSHGDPMEFHALSLVVFAWTRRVWLHQPATPAKQRTCQEVVMFRSRPITLGLEPEFDKSPSVHAAFLRVNRSPGQVLSKIRTHESNGDRGSVIRRLFRWIVLLQSCSSPFPRMCIQVAKACHASAKHFVYKSQYSSGLYRVELIKRQAKQIRFCWFSLLLAYFVPSRRVHPGTEGK